MPRPYRSLAVVWLLLAFTFGAPAVAAVKPGAQVAAEEGFSFLRGKRYGLVTNATAMVGSEHLLDILIAAGVPPTRLFAPEHGLLGKAEDGVRIADERGRDIPLVSLYGERKKPRPEDLADLELLVFDMQDVGARFYTYISTLGRALQGAAEAGLPFVVLDRPNPLGGDYVAGFVRERQLASFTSLYPIPIAHGLTMGELALMIKGEAMLPGLELSEIAVVRMVGWERRLRWSQTGLPWVPTSPNIPDAETALLYAGVGLLEATSANEGRGTYTPFKVAGMPALDAKRLAGALNARRLPGVLFETAHYTPVAIPGMSSSPKHCNRQVSGVRLLVTDADALRPVETGVELLAAIHEQLGPAERGKYFRDLDWMAGSRRLREWVARPVGSPGELWQEEVEVFRRVREPYLLYR